MNGWMDGWSIGCLEGCTDGRIDGWSVRIEVEQGLKPIRNIMAVNSIAYYHYTGPIYMQVLVVEFLLLLIKMYFKSFLSLFMEEVNRTTIHTIAPILLQ